MIDWAYIGKFVTVFVFSTVAITAGMLAADWVMELYHRRRKK